MAHFPTPDHDWLRPVCASCVHREGPDGAQCPVRYAHCLYNSAQRPPEGADAVEIARAAAYADILDVLIPRGETLCPMYIEAERPSPAEWGGAAAWTAEERRVLSEGGWTPLEALPGVLRASLATSGRPLVTIEFRLDEVTPELVAQADRAEVRLAVGLRSDMIDRLPVVLKLLAYKSMTAEERLSSSRGPAPGGKPYDSLAARAHLRSLWSAIQDGGGDDAA